MENNLNMSVRVVFFVLLAMVPPAHASVAGVVSKLCECFALPFTRGIDYNSPPGISSRLFLFSNYENI